RGARRGGRGGDGARGGRGADRAVGRADGGASRGKSAAAGSGDGLRVTARSTSGRRRVTACLTSWGRAAAPAATPPAFALRLPRNGKRLRNSFRRLVRIRALGAVPGDRCRCEVVSAGPEVLDDVRRHSRTVDLDRV